MFQCCFVAVCGVFCPATSNSGQHLRLNNYVKISKILDVSSLGKIERFYHWWRPWWYQSGHWWSPFPCSSQIYRVRHLKYKVRQNFIRNWFELGPQLHLVLRWNLELRLVRSLSLTHYSYELGSQNDHSSTTNLIYDEFNLERLWNIWRQLWQIAIHYRHFISTTKRATTSA